MSETVGRGRPDDDGRARRRRYRLGLAFELLAAALLTAKGYRVLARRWRCPRGEIDLVAVRRGRVAFVEVKQRRTFEEAEAAITSSQRQRVRDAAAVWLSRHPTYQSHEVGFDLILMVPRRWPRHLTNCL